MKQSPFADFDPFEFTCDRCGKKRVFTEEEIEKVKQKVPHTTDDYFIPCSFCQKGRMEPPTMVMFDGQFE